jgi:F-type H+-transporting ATPase subunit delta
MSDTVVAKRYAKALFQVAQEKGIVSQVEEDLRTVVQVIRDNGEFAQLLSHPNVDTSVKLTMLENVFKGKVQDAVLRITQLLIERRRESLLSVVLIDYVRIVADVLDQATALVTTPVALTSEASAQIAEQFGKLTGKKIRVENAIDASLLGGLTVRIGDRLYDGSLSSKLNRLQKSLNQAQAL